MSEIYNLYKPLRNYLRKLSLVDSLQVIRAYMQHLQFDREFPSDIQVSQEFLSAAGVNKGIFPWELELLAREIIINTPNVDPSRAEQTLKDWSCFSRAINKVKELENRIGRYYPRRDFKIELYRIAHRQFPWQIKPNGICLTRYYKIFSDSGLDQIIQRVIGLTVRELYVFGLALSGLYLESFSSEYPPNIQIEDISPDKFGAFSDRFVSDLSIIKQRLVESRQFAENYLYAFNPICAYPLIKMNIGDKQGLICPIPTLLFRRFTGGVFYEICNERDFGDSYGRSFQNYVGEVISSAISGKSFRVYEAREFHVRGERKDTVDWIVDDSSAALFIECKTKRLNYDARIDVSSERAEEEFNKMADFVVQVYKTIRDYRDNHYPDFPFDNRKKVFPVILTLEEWFVFGDRIYEQLDASLKTKLDEAGLENTWLSEMPYSIWSIEDFEKGIQIISNVGIEDFVQLKVSDPEKRQWALHSYMVNDHRQQYMMTRALFPNILDVITGK